MSNSAQDMTECITALTALVSALHHLMDGYPALREQLMPATMRLSEALPCVSSFLSIDIGELNAGLTEVERRLTLLESDVAQLKMDVALLRDDVIEVKVAIAGINGRLDTFATKEDLHKQTWRIYGAMGTLMAVFYFLVRYFH